MRRFTTHFIFIFVMALTIHNFDLMDRRLFVIRYSSKLKLYHVFFFFLFFIGDWHDEIILGIASINSVRNNIRNSNACKWAISMAIFDGLLPLWSYLKIKLIQLLFYCLKCWWINNNNNNWFAQLIEIIEIADQATIHDTQMQNIHQWFILLGCENIKL